MEIIRWECVAMLKATGVNDEAFGWEGVAKDEKLPLFIGIFTGVSVNCFVCPKLYT